MNLIELYEKMYLIRKVEETIIENYYDNEMKTPMHMSKGEEAIVVGICSALGERGQYFGTYRSHALYLALGGDLNKFFAEMYGKKDGRYAGKSGSMHISSPENGYISSSAIVASNIPVAVGAAWVNKIKDNGKIVVVFFGDGATEEGNFWESINMASLWGLPIMFICEDNGLAVFTPSSQRKGYYNISDITDNFYMSTYDYRVTRVDHIYYHVKKVIEEMDNKKTPSFIKFQYYRYLEHVGVNEDADLDYRSENRIEDWSDPLHHCKVIMERDQINSEAINKIELNVNERVQKSLDFSKKSEFSNTNDVFKDVFYG